MKKPYYLVLFFCLTGLLNATNKLSLCSCILIGTAALGNSMVHLYGYKKTMQYLLFSLMVHTILAWHTAYAIQGVRFDYMIPISFLAVLMSLDAGMHAFAGLKSTHGFALRNGIGLLVASILDSSIVMLYMASKFSAHKVLATFLKDIAYKCGYSIAVSGIIVAGTYLYRRWYLGTAVPQNENQNPTPIIPLLRACGEDNMGMKRKKQFLIGLCIACFPIAHQTYAIGLSMGPALAVNGYYRSFDTKNPSMPKYRFSTAGGQIGGFAKVDVGLFYVKSDILFAVNRLKLSDRLSATYFQNCFVPLSVGSTLFGVLCPHLGCIFKLPIKNTIPNKQALSALNKNKFHGFLFGLGIHTMRIVVDLDFEIMQGSIPRHALYAQLTDAQKTYTPNMWTLRVGWNK
jgi:hypothetical protein